jgi:hypothetical protein
MGVDIFGNVRAYFYKGNIMTFKKLLGSTSLSGIGGFPAPTKRHSSTQTHVSPASGSFDFEMGSQERGVIISNPLTIDGTSISIKNSEIDPIDLRRSLLFWDKIIWPVTNGIYIDGGVDTEFLEAQNKLLRPLFSVNGDVATGLSMAFTETYRVLSERNPGQWLLTEGEKSLQIHGKQIEQGRGVIAHLINAVPVPDRTMPLEDVIRFKEKRGDEVIALRTRIDEFYQEWVNSEDKEHQLMLAVTKIDMASADMVKVARESKSPFSMSSWKINYSASPDAMKALMGYLSAAEALELGIVGSLLSGAASSMLSVGTDIGLRNSKINSPFNYVASMEGSLF